MAIHSETTAQDRIGILRRRTREAFDQELHDFRRAVAARVCEEYRHEPQVVKVARVTEAFQREKPLVIFDEDIVAGYSQRYDFWMPDIDPHPSNCPPRKIAPDRPWERRLPEQVRGGFVSGLFSTCPGAHHIPGYRRVLERGLGGLIAEARARLETATGDARDFARAALIATESASRYALRYAEAFDRSAARHPSHRRIAEACRWVATNPPRTFFEALQLLWLAVETVHCEQTVGALSLGRLDQYLYPYYERDLAAGILAREEAQELIEALWIKFGGTPMSFQHITLGGLDRHGRYAANDLTYMGLRATKRLRMDQPLVGLRWHPSIPDDLWEEAQELIRLGTGFPALFNDEKCIEAKVRQGIPWEEAVDYGIVGCVEMSMPGREFAHTEAFRINWLKVLELMLNRGTCPLSGETFGLLEPGRLDTVRTFDEFRDWYERELLHAVDIGAAAMDIIDEDYPRYKPTPFASVTCDGCLEKGKDVSDGGTVWNFSTINATGQANVADALVAIKRLVFDDRRMTLTELAAILRQDFAGFEGLREEVLRYPKYGNDAPEPDTLCAELVKAFCERVAAHTNRRGGPFQVGLFTAGWHGVLGELTGASPDGRRARSALCSGASAAQGADGTGPTALVRSATRFDHAAAANGLVLDIKFHPSFFNDDSRRRAFKHLVETYFRLGGMELQVNVIGRDVLLDAQRHPERHRDLLVRVSGYSAYFVDLSKVLQDELIERTEMTAL